MKKYKAISLFSGGLDSIIAVKWMEKIGVDVIPVFFETPFFKGTRAKLAAEKAGIDVQVINISEEHLNMLKEPKYGFGKNMNPCIDCHGLMFRKAAELLETWKADFLVSGEVLGQRPMSQRKDAMNSVRKLSNVKDLIIRPLCQKLLPDTLPIRENWIKKDALLDIQGRSRTRQLELAKEFGIDDFQTPGGGCLLTESRYSDRLSDLIKHDMLTPYYCEFLSYGRHYRISENTKLIIGRKRSDNNALTELATNEIVMKTSTITGPLGFIQSKVDISDEDLKVCASIVLRYNNKAPSKYTLDYGIKFNLNSQIEVSKLDDEQVQTYNINGQFQKK